MCTYTFFKKNSPPEMHYKGIIKNVQIFIYKRLHPRISHYSEKLGNTSCQKIGDRLINYSPFI